VSASFATIETDEKRAREGGVVRDVSVARFSSGLNQAGTASGGRAPSRRKKPRRNERRAAD
jgi:hypothetical protein